MKERDHRPNHDSDDADYEREHVGDDEAPFPMWCWSCGQRFPVWPRHLDDHGPNCPHCADDIYPLMFDPPPPPDERELTVEDSAGRGYPTGSAPRRDIEPPDPYYQHEHFIGDAPLRGRSTGLHLRIHMQEERYAERHEIFPLSSRRGTRTYVHAKPYLLEPDIRLTVALTPQSRPTDPIGRVVGAEQRNWRRREIGQCQAWHYPADKTIVLWESYLNDWLQTGDDPAQDPAHVALWQGFERWLVGHLSPVEQLVTTWEDLYARERWQAFLAEQGYQPFGPGAPAAFVKRRTHR